jgi:DNA-binding SARP family transcriptional activator
VPEDRSRRRRPFGTSHDASFGGLLYRFRTRAGLTQAALADRAGVGVRTVRELEHDRVTRPRPAAVDRISGVLRLSTVEHTQLLAAIAGPSNARRSLHIEVLGPMRVRRGDHLIDAGPLKERLLLGLLAVQSERPVSAAEIAELLWPDRPPRTYRGLVHTYVARLRQRLGDENGTPVIGRDRTGYRLILPPDQVDAARFQRLAERARSAYERGDTDRARELFAAGLGCWRGPVLSDAGPRLRPYPAAAALARQQLACAVTYADLALAAGQGAEAVALLRGIADAEPLHEGVHARLMLALAGAGDQAAALQLFAELRDRLSEELGVSPGAELVDAHVRVLRQQVSLPSTVVNTSQVGTVVPAQLPAAVGDFIGRDAERQRLTARVRGDRSALSIVVVTGPPGVGKTAFAVHWAHRIAASYPDGQLYLDLHGYSVDRPLRPLDALRRLLGAYGVTGGRVPRDADTASALFRTTLAGRRVLLVLDNAASADQVRPLLPGDSGCLVLVTSRDSLHGLTATHGAYRMRLEVLPPPEAVELLGTLLDGSPKETLGELAELCGRLPLALRVAAAHVATGRTTVDGLVAELSQDDRLGRLAVDGDSVAVAAAFDRSYGALGSRERRLFRLMGVVPWSQITVDASAALTALPVPETTRLLDRLAREHLLEVRGDGRYGFHDLIRRYAADRARAEESAADLDLALHRVVGWYAAGVDAAADILYPQMFRLTGEVPPAGAPVFADRPSALAWLDAEHPSIVATVRAVTGRPWPELCVLADRMRGYFEHRRHLDDWFDVAEAGIRAATNSRAEGACRLSLGVARGCAAQFADARRQFTVVLRLARADGWAELSAVAHARLGTVHIELGRLGRATRHYQSAAIGLGRLDWTIPQAAAYVNLGYVAYHRGALAAAVRHQTEALALVDKTSAVSLEACAREYLGTASHALGRLPEAVEQLQLALSRHRQVGNRTGEGTVLASLALVRLDLGDQRQARELAESALHLAAAAGRASVHVAALHSLGTVALHAGEPARAAVRYARATRLADRLGQPFPAIEALLGRAAAAVRLGRPAPAIRYGRRALLRARRHGYRRLETRARAVLRPIRSLPVVQWRLRRVVWRRRSASLGRSRSRV